MMAWEEVTAMWVGLRMLSKHRIKGLRFDALKA